MAFPDPNPEGMARIVDGLGSKSEMIRALAGRGYRQADIARFLDIKDQFVSNVVRAARQKGQLQAPQPDTAGAGPEQTWLLVDSAGRVVIPAAFRSALGVEPGGRVLAHMVDGEMRLLTQKHALDKARDLVRRYVPEGEGLVEGLIRERREEARRESGNG